MNTLPDTAPRLERFSKKEAKEWRQYKERFGILPFTDYSANVLEAYRTFEPSRFASRYLFCTAANGEYARNYFSNIYAESDFPTEDAARIDIDTDKNELFLRNKIPVDIFFHMGLVKAVEEGDVTALVDGLEQWLRHHYLSRYLDRIGAEGKYFFVFSLPKQGILVNDHAAFEYAVLRAYACGRPDFARCFFRKSMGLSELATTACTVNLCMAIMYDDVQWKEQALAQAAVESKKTTSKITKARIAFFTSLIHQDAEGVGDALATLAQARPSAVWEDSWQNFCNINHHGLCSFAQHHLDAGTFSKVRLPATTGWWADIAEHCMQSALPRPRTQSLFRFGGELSFLDDLARAIDKDCC